MYVVSATLDEPAPIAASEGLRYGVPSAFKGCSGVYHPAGGTIGVVLCAPWGFEDLSMRKSWRLLAESLAKAGFPVMRFDYPCTGNSLGHANEAVSVGDWVASIHDAAEMLRKNSGVRRFVFVGQSLGATLAMEAARTRGDVVGLQLIAPVARGRAYVRELAATARMVADKIGIKPDPVSGQALSVIGFPLSSSMVESLKALDLTKIDSLPIAEIVVYDTPDRKAGVETAEHLRRLGAKVGFEAVPPYHLMISDATAIQPLPVAAEAVVAAMRARHPMVVAPVVPIAPAFPSALVGADFREEPVRFGPGGALFGIFCQPPHPRPGAPVFVLLNRGLNAHIGWRRVSVEHARGLAAVGIASLRIDVAGLGESRDEPDRPANLIYSDLLLPDIRAAVDWVVARGHARVALAGVCSGAYMAIAAAHADPRVTDLVAVNPQRIVWNPTESVEDVIRFGLRSMNDYVGDIKSRGALRKLIRRRRRLVPAVRFLATRAVRNAMGKVPLGLRSALLRDSMAARVARIFAALAENGTRVLLVFSEGDPGLLELRHYYGPNGCHLRHSNVSVSLVADADHNLTTTQASAAMLEHMIAFALEAPVRDDAPSAACPRREPQHAVCPT